MSTVEERSFKSGDLVDRAGSVLRGPNALRGNRTGAIRAEGRHVCCGRGREEGFVRADVRHRLLAADMLLTRLEGHAERAMTFRVSRQADHPSGHLPDVLLPAREDSQERPAEVHLRPEWLSFSDDDVRSEVPRRTDDRLRDWIHPDDEHAVRHGSHFTELLFESAGEGP